MHRQACHTTVFTHVWFALILSHELSCIFYFFPSDVCVFVVLHIWLCRCRENWDYCHWDPNVQHLAPWFSSMFWRGER